MVTTMPKSMNAYHYSFESTGNPAIDEILIEVASAGKGCPHTMDWNYYGFITKIQNAANEAAKVR